MNTVPPFVQRGRASSRVFAVLVILQATADLYGQFSIRRLVSAQSPEVGSSLDWSFYASIGLTAAVGLGALIWIAGYRVAGKIFIALILFQTMFTVVLSIKQQIPFLKIFGLQFVLLLLAIVLLIERDRHAGLLR